MTNRQEPQEHILDLRAELEVATILNEQKEAQSLFTAIVTRATDRITTKHDPWCDCGICQHCRGDEDKFGNPTRGAGIEIGKIRREIEILAAIGCSECTESRTDTLYSVDLAGFRLQFATEAWKHGWIVEGDKVLCPNCRADAEEWRSI